MYAIVDIETTGAYAAANGITEISIQVSDGKKVVDRFDTLINPLQHIPPYIQAMTGISDEMVATAPVFEEVAQRVYALLHDKVFVAHNVNFDYSFLKSQLQYCGYDLNCKKICTVRMSRKILPGHKSYSLGKLCDSLGLWHVQRHRAGGDTDATVELFHLLLKNDADQHILKSLQRDSKEQVLPPNVPKADFERLPYTPGVYYFHDEKGKVVYVGKAKNLRYRVNSHFSNNSAGRQKQNFMRHVFRISFEECGTELMATVKESFEIKRLWPRFNASQKKREDIYGMLSYIDQNGYRRLAIDRVKNSGGVFGTFHHLENARAMLRQLVREHNLCPRLCFLGEEMYDGQHHDDHCRGACEKTEPAPVYNERVGAAVEKLKNLPSFAIIDKGLGQDDKSAS
ncbi:MAG: exonuclease domain-containing protein [Niabella sp.]